MSRFLTLQQRSLLSLIEETIERTGSAPTFDMMRMAMGLASKSGVHRLISELEDKGAIVRLPHRARAIALPPKGLTLSPELSAELRRYLGSPAAIEAAIRSAILEQAGA